MAGYLPYGNKVAVLLRPRPKKPKCKCQSLSPSTLLARTGYMRHQSHPTPSSHARQVSADPYIVIHSARRYTPHRALLFQKEPTGNSITSRENLTNGISVSSTG